MVEVEKARKDMEERMKPINPHELAEHIGQGLIDGLTAQQQKRKIRSHGERMHSMKLSEFIEKYGDRKIDEQKLKETLNIESKGWVPEWGEGFYFVGVSGKVFYKILNKSNCHIPLYCRIFQTREETEFEAERQKFKRFMEREFAENSDLIDWEDERQNKWYIDNDVTISHVTPTYCNFIRTQGTLFTTNEFWLREFIEQHEDDIKRYCFGVEK